MMVDVRNTYCKNVLSSILVLFCSVMYFYFQDCILQSFPWPKTSDLQTGGKSRVNRRQQTWANGSTLARLSKSIHDSPLIQAQIICDSRLPRLRYQDAKTRLVDEDQVCTPIRPSLGGNKQAGQEISVIRSQNKKWNTLPNVCCNIPVLNAWKFTKFTLKHI